MVIIFTFALIIVMLFYFGAIRLLDKKKREFMQFLVMYLFALVCMLCISYIVVRERAGENWHLFFHPIRDQLFMAAYYVPPTFLVSYLLYPFKLIKRSRMLIWILAGYTLIVVGGSAALNILVAFSNM